MKQWRSVDEVLDFAISEEEAAAAFYSRLARETSNAAMRQAFEGFAREELGHKDKLKAVRLWQCFPAENKPVPDLKIADYVTDVEPTPDMSYRDALTVAMKKEKAAYRLYTWLADRVQDAKLKAVFVSLAQEEAKHKLRFEIEYDDLMKDQ